MEQNKDNVIDPPQGSVSGQGDSPSVLLHSSKLRNKLDSLAQWRIDPSQIEFLPYAREFRGGFATVLQGRLAAKDDANERGSKSPNPQPHSDKQESRDEVQAKDKGEDSSTAGGENDHTQGEGRTAGGKVQRPPDESSLSMSGEGFAPSGYGEYKDPDSSDLNLKSLSDALEPEGGPQDREEGTNGGITSADDSRVREGETRESERTDEEQNHDTQASKPKVVAVKKMKIENETDLERVLGLALREAEFLVQLSHSNIIKLEGFVEDLSGHKVWLVFPWEEHGNLRDFLATGEWEIPERISLIDDVTQGLEYLHTREPPVYHGDLKSLNILVNSQCYALITDFGSARYLGDDEVGTQRKQKDQKPPPATHPTTDEPHITLEALFSATASTLTLTGSGYTLRWAAPELLQDEKPCLGSDIWALGWIAYEVMTNTIPFHDIKKDAIVIKNVIQGRLPSVTEHARMSLIRSLCSVMVRCWSISPDNRPTAEECRKLISWMPMIVPAPVQTTDEAASQLRYAELLGQLGRMYQSQSDYPSASDCFNQALNIYTSNNDSSGRATMLRGLAHVHRSRDEFPDAITFYSEALQISIDAGDESGKAYSLFGLAEMHRLRDEYSEAHKLYSACLQIHTDSGERKSRAAALWGLADIHRLQHEYRQARELYSEALQIYNDVGDRRETALTLWSLAEVHRFQEEYREAINLHSEALQIYTDIGDEKERASTLWSLAEVHLDQQEYSTARKLYSESLQICTAIGDRHGRGDALRGLAKVHQALHDYEEAIKLHTEAAQLFADIGDKSWSAVALMSLAEINQMQGHLSEAISLFTDASEVWKEIGDSESASDALRNAADLQRRLQQADTDSAE